MISIIIACGAMAVTGGLVTMVGNIKPTREARKIHIERQFRARAFKDVAAKAVSEILDAPPIVVSNGDGEAVTDDGDTEGPANPR